MLQHHYGHCLPIKLVSKRLLCNRHALALHVDVCILTQNLAMQLSDHHRLLNSVDSHAAPNVHVSIMPLAAV